MREFALDYLAWSIVGQWTIVIAGAMIVVGGTVAALLRKEMDRRAAVKYLRWSLEQDEKEDLQ